MQLEVKQQNGGRMLLNIAKEFSSDGWMKRRKNEVTSRQSAFLKAIPVASRSLSAIAL